MDIPGYCCQMYIFPTRFLSPRTVCEFCRAVLFPLCRFFFLFIVPHSHPVCKHVFIYLERLGTKTAIKCTHCITVNELLYDAF